VIAEINAESRRTETSRTRAQLADLRIAQRHLHEAARQLRPRQHVLEQQGDRLADRLVPRESEEPRGRQSFDRLGVRGDHHAPRDLEVDLVLVVEVAIEGPTETPARCAISGVPTAS